MSVDFGLADLEAPDVDLELLGFSVDDLEALEALDLDLEKLLDAALEDFEDLDRRACPGWLRASAS